jgi:aspartyl-tRNA(Asn)/glutamyl-tRNA(Gln) amidotransferase subunit C
MSISVEEVRAMARLARLAVAESDLAGYAEQLSKIVDFVGQMETVKTDDVAPLAHPQELSARLRSDSVTEIDQRAGYQQGAPQVNDGLYLVPQVHE